jgi:hypothetical protein
MSASAKESIVVVRRSMGEARLRIRVGGGRGGNRGEGILMFILILLDN